jgi:transcriptional antiterminator NusG
MTNIDKEEIEAIAISSDKRFEWYALMCIPNHEKSVKKAIDANLKLANLEKWVDVIHVPTMKEVNVKNGKRIVKDKVMIPGYILVHMDLKNGEVIPCIRASKGVSSWLNPTDGKLKQTPEKMRNRDIQRFLNVGAKNDKSLDINFVVGEKIEIVNGAFSTFTATIKSINNDKISVTTDIFGRETDVELSSLDIKKYVK